MGKNKKRDERKGKGEIKIVDPSTREYTFVEDFTLAGFYNNITSRDSAYIDKSKDTRKLDDIRKKKTDPLNDFRYKSKGKNIRSGQTHSPVYE
jgi:hypothetical protein